MASHAAQLPANGLHVAIRWDLADAAARAALTLAAEDAGGIALQRDVGRLFGLVAAVPSPVWHEVQDAAELRALIALKADQTALDAVNAALSAKADQAALNTLTTTVGTKAAQSAVDTLSAQVATNTTSIGTKASQSSLDTLSAVVSTNTSAISTKADSSALATTNSAVSTNTSAITALRAPVYLVQTATSTLDNERVVTGVEGVTADYGTAGQLILRGPQAALDAITAALALKASQSSLDTTNANVSANTAAIAANTTAIAGKSTAAFTKNSQAGTTYTLALSDQPNGWVEMTNDLANTVTIPPNASVALPQMVPITVARHGIGVTTIKAGAGVTLLPADSLMIDVRYGTATLVQVAANTWYVKGEVAA